MYKMVQWIKGGELMLAICGLVFLLGGVIMKIWPPKEINMLYGYRTPLSTSSDRAWKLAQKHSAQMMLKYGLVMLGIGLVLHFYSLTGRYSEKLLLIELIILLPLFIFLMIFSTHRYLKRTL